MGNIFLLNRSCWSFIICYLQIKLYKSILESKIKCSYVWDIVIWFPCTVRGIYGVDFECDGRKCRLNLYHRKIKWQLKQIAANISLSFELWDVILVMNKALTRTSVQKNTCFVAENYFSGKYMELIRFTILQFACVFNPFGMRKKNIIQNINLMDFDSHIPYFIMTVNHYSLLYSCSGITDNPNSLRNSQIYL